MALFNKVEREKVNLMPNYILTLSITDKFIKKDGNLSCAISIQRNYFERKLQELADQIKLNLRNKNNMDGYRIYNLGNLVENTDATSKQFVEAGLRNLEGFEDHKNDMGDEKIVNVGNPTQPVNLQTV